MKRLHLFEIKHERKYFDELFEIEKCGNNIQGVDITHVYIDGQHNHVLATLPNGLGYRFFGSCTIDLIDELNAFIRGFNAAIEVID